MRRQPRKALPDDVFGGRTRPYASGVTRALVSPEPSRNQAGTRPIDHDTDLRDEAVLVAVAPGHTPAASGPTSHAIAVIRPDPPPTLDDRAR
jgi:hypothetical protein